MLKPKFTENDIIKSLLNKPKTIYEIQSSLGSSRRTVWNKLMKMLDEGTVKRKNRGNPNKPLYEYYLSEGIKPEASVKKTFSNLTRSLKVKEI